MKYTFKKIWLLLFMSCLNCMLLSANVYGQTEQYIRVAILQDAPSLNLKISGICEVLDGPTGAVLYRGKNLNTTVTAYKGGILIAGNNFASRQVLVRSGDQSPIVINGRLFSGDIGLIKKDGGHLLVLNIIGLEDYVKGILYHEASHYWPMDALRAQAVVSRTYAVYQMQENKSRDFDVTCDIYSQVYGGKTSERFRTNEAVDDTRGQILTYEGKIIPAYFHATCGGHTQDASLLWNVNIAPLKGVICVFCKDSPHFRWHDTLPLAEIEKKLSGQVTI
ncbi:MAG: SpoIID/LytB domain-containing protein [Candidatus Omnitrophica bacterium]|nr:SpoIID/LytB domain-containing protein [Candidatus Omnitrophota bacterium]